MNLKPKHILVIRLSAMGDVAMVVPVLKALQSQNEGLKVTLVSKPFFEPIFKDLHRVNFFGIDVHGKHKGFFGLRKLAKELIALEIDAVADLHNVLRSNILLRFLKRDGIPGFQIDKGRAEKRALIKGVYKPLKSSHERYSDVLENMDFIYTLIQISFL
jgi:ADP-heptose:LPS heptosyltransferase